MSSFLINRFSSLGSKSNRSNGTTSPSPTPTSTTIASTTTSRARRKLDVGEGNQEAESSPSTTSVEDPDNKRRQATMRMYRQRTLKDYQIMLEFRHLKQHSPAGIYLLPSFENLRKWSGILFIRKGLYKGGIFRFHLELPRSYPADGACPRVHFQTPVYHPHVDKHTGKVDVLSHFQGQWIAGEHYIVVVLSVLKSMFFFQNTNMTNIKLAVQNSAALKQWDDSKGNGRLNFMKIVRDCVEDSILASGGHEGQGDFENPEDSVITFSKHQKQHEVMKNNLTQTGSIRGQPFVMSPKILLSKRRKASTTD